MTTETSLADRLARVLEPLRPNCWHGPCPERSRQWACLCLSDDSAAVKLVEEYWPGHVFAERDANGWIVKLCSNPGRFPGESGSFISAAAGLVFKVLGDSSEDPDTWGPWDEEPIIAPTLHEAICAAFVAAHPEGGQE